MSRLSSAAPPLPSLPSELLLRAAGGGQSLLHPLMSPRHSPCHLLPWLVCAGCGLSCLGAQGLHKCHKQINPRAPTWAICAFSFSLWRRAAGCSSCFYRNCSCNFPLSDIGLSPLDALSLWPLVWRRPVWQSLPLYICPVHQNISTSPPWLAHSWCERSVSWHSDGINPFFL